MNAICPDFIIDTDFDYYELGTEGCADEFVLASDVIAEKLHRNRLADNCVNAVSFVTKESAGFLTGVIIRVDEGASIKSVI